MSTTSFILIILSLVIYSIRCLLNKKDKIGKNVSLILIIIALLFDLLSGLLAL